MNNKIRHEPMRIAGKKIDAEKVIEVEYPYTGEVIGTVPAGNAEHAKKAFDIAANFKPKLTRYERQKILQKTAEELVKRKEVISDIITYELGISKQDSLYEVGRAFDVFSLTSQLCIYDDGEIFSCDLTPHGKARKIFTIREPLNAISAITPFNHPLNMVAHKIAPSIATNNCTVCKQTELTPMTVMALADILYEAGLPPEMFSVVTGWPQDIGLEMIQNANIDLITFTGSVSVGKYIAEQAGYKRTVLELGGNDPLIILNDLNDDDLNNAAELAVTGATKNSGQRCTAVKRILCQNKVADKFVQMILDKAKKINFGDPMNMNTDLGTVINAQAAELFDKRVSVAADEGAKILFHPGLQGALLPPIVLDNVNPTSELVLEETFGPVIPIIRVPDEDDEVIKISNSTAFGLSSGVCTNNFMRAKKYIKSLNVGTVNIWEVPGYRIEMSPFGGIKDSGLGYKEGAIEAMKSFTNIKTFSLPW
ncbi:MAG: NADP-dependent glyceraldehyde-3-phosphate dehydrogenase [Alphaproteobacteria bacterium MarineAlpha5_Bin5]|nr:MAG: NADP-dependent glyceraldehyde-3-phosphate dehydrogenase [Alphaproteobacteria bacterium MarineAlpha5_Bin4]PPR50612.1 MAG: NADP-dependent glyceraldehyde-3-phosphate dehydrogenase [Alphaproteobacteria bacterium MarineAlpha5_Bin5]|tara:strand:+ start:2513 stop:3952 length:1440 start_codon:yes stop_codon:yes gene_type:complete